MMKHYIKYIPALLFSLLAFATKAQDVLRFDKRFVQCEDRWVAFERDKDGIYPFGFIYIDPEAGFTIYYEGRFKIADNGVFIPEKPDESKARVKARLQANEVKVAWIPSVKFAELRIPETPVWLSNYKTDTGTVERLYHRGFLYNSWGASERALLYLEKAADINPRYPGLTFELAYAYNALSRYQQAITVLAPAIEADSTNCYLYKELSYAEMHLGDVGRSAETARKGILFCSDTTLKAEIAYNITQEYFQRRDKEKFTQWAMETKKWALREERFTDGIDQMRAELGL